MQIHEISKHNTKYWVLDEVYADFNATWFEAAPLLSVSSQTHQQGGRQAVSRLTRADINMVLRHYCRGGVPARLSKDQFIFHSYRASRPCRELQLLSAMQQLALPVPTPVAARCQRNGIFYRADILMQEIPATQTLVHHLTQTELDARLWQRIGETIRRFHQQGIQHVDLNANNILLDAQEGVFLIDFDRCRQTSYASSWAERGMQRLARSLAKEKMRNPAMHYDAAMFAMLRQGYLA